MMMDWAAYRQQLDSTLGQLAKLTPGTMQGVNALGEAGNKTNHLDEKTRELIALAVAVTTHCDGCIAYHTKAAREAGANQGELAEALGVAIAMNAGAALIYSARAFDAFKQAEGQ